MKDKIFGAMHFLFIVPFLLLASGIIIYVVSLCYPKPSIEKLKDTVTKD